MPRPRAGARAALFGGVALVALTLVVFAGGLENGFVWDDHSLILFNRHIREPEGVKDVLTRPFWATSSATDNVNAVYSRVYRPVVTAAYIAQFKAFGESATGYHAVSLALHVLIVLLVWRLLVARMVAEAAEGTEGFCGPWPALAGAFAFALHPSRPESVSWVSGSTELWMTVWVALGLLAWTVRTRPWAPAATALCFVLAIASKETAVFAPVLLATDALLRGELRASWKALAGVCLAAAAGLGLRLWLVPIAGAGAVGTDGGTVARVTSSLGHYVGHVLWPWKPSLSLGTRHTLPNGATLLDPTSLALGAAVGLGLVVLALAAWRRPALRPWLADALWIVLPLAPVLNVVDLGAIGLAASRFVYLPLFGFASMMARAVGLAIRRGPPVRGPVLAITATLLVGYGVISQAHVRHFRDDGALWLYELDLDPAHIYAFTELATLAHQERQPERASDLFWSAYNAARKEGNVWTRVALASKLLDEIMSMTAEVDQRSLRHFRDAFVRVETEHVFSYDVGAVHVEEQLPGPVRAAFMNDAKYYRVPRAITMLRTGDLPRAERELMATLKVSSAPMVWTMLVWVLSRQGKWEPAERALREAEQRMPGHAGIVATRQTFDRARAMAARPASDDVAKRLQAARVALALGGVEEARQLARALLSEGPGHFEFAMLAAEVEAGDRQFDAGRAIIEGAMDLGLEPERPWDQALASLEQARSQAAFVTHVWPAPTTKP